MERVHIDGRDTRGVRARFYREDGVTIEFTGAPQLDLGAIIVKLTRGTRYRDDECHGLTLAINAVPTRPEKYRGRRNDHGRFEAQARFDFHSFKPLADNLPELSVHGCTASWKFSRDDIQTLRSFFVIYSQLAKKAKEEGSGDDGSQKVDAPVTEL